jgi:bifunctional N-acetylglucosamine-1-phosphate-uridyltransferase/glucosamine-1-phosphate-acetyltransferase GlmU-like protein
VELAEVSRIVRQQKNNELMDAGATIDPATTHVDRSVDRGDTILHPGVSLSRTTIGRLRDPAVLALSTRGSATA